MSTSAGLTAAGAVLVCAVFLATVVSRGLHPGPGRRLTDETALILGFAAPALALLSPWLHDRLWPPAAVIAAGYGGFYLVRMRQLRRANRDGVRMLLGLDKNATFGEVWQNAERLDPKPVTNTGRLVIAARRGRPDRGRLPDRPLRHGPDRLDAGGGRHDPQAGLPPRPGQEGAPDRTLTALVANATNTA